MCKKAITAMSGGVDSSVAALLLNERGYENVGITLKLYDNADVGISREKTCCSIDDINDAQRVCAKLGIPHYVFNFSDDFAKYVIDNFTETYLCGKTPNPCIECNRHIKFRILLERAKQMDFDYIATGHYCSTERDSATGRYMLKKALDDTKDQTYVLYMLTQEQLSHTLFPLGGMTKKQVREIAEQSGLINARKHDSQDICFVKDGDYRSFIENRTGKHFECGDFRLADGTKVGTHKGIIGYTTGQRKGLGIAYSEPLYVVSKDVENNVVTVGKQNELFSKRVKVKDVNFMPFESLSSPMKINAKLRYKQKESPCTMFPDGENSVILEFDDPQRAVTSGQAAVFYDGEYVVGGGTIV